MKWTIRQEREGDEAAIAAVVRAAFEGKPYADENDEKIVGRLRKNGALVLSLVAIARGRIVGQVALSPATVGSQRYLAVGPLAVLPEDQGKGVGADLMEHALGVARVYGRDGVVLQGSLTYYPRFGFVTSPDVTCAGGGAEYLQVLPFTGRPSGAVRWHPALTG